MGSIWAALKKELTGLNHSRKYLRKRPKYLPIATAFILVAILFTSLFVATPVSAVQLNLINLPTSMVIGTQYSFNAEINILSGEALPITNINLNITNITGPTPVSSVSAVFNVNGNITNQTGQIVSITPVLPLPQSILGNGSASGFGFQPGATVPGNFSTPFGYGVNYTTNATYQITLATSALTAGSYNAQLSIDVPPTGTKYISSDYPFTLSPAPSYGGGSSGGGGGGNPPTISGVDSVSFYVSPSGMTANNINIKSDDNVCTASIASGTTILDASGKPVASITVAPPATPAPLPPNRNVLVMYDFGPKGATFSPPIKITMNIPAGVDPTGLTIAYYDTATNTWTDLTNITIDTASGTISGYAAHFTEFAILSKPIVVATPTPTPTPNASPKPTITPTPSPTSAAPTLTPSPTPSPLPATTSGGFNWWSIIGAVVVIAVAVVIVMFIFRRRNS